MLARGGMVAPQRTSRSRRRPSWEAGRHLHAEARCASPSPTSAPSPGTAAAVERGGATAVRDDHATEQGPGRAALRGPLAAPCRPPPAPPIPVTCPARAATTSAYVARDCCCATPSERSPPTPACGPTTSGSSTPPRWSAAAHRRRSRARRWPGGPPTAGAVNATFKGQLDLERHGGRTRLGSRSGSCGASSPRRPRSGTTTSSDSLTYGSLVRYDLKLWIGSGESATYLPG